MLGVILCGGQSTRMGADKGLIKLHADSWAQSAVNKMSSLQLAVVLSINSNQLTDYQTEFPNSQLTFDAPDLNVRGPLAGILSVHVQHPGKDLFILACDMPLMETSILEILYLHYQQQPSKEAYYFTNDAEPEPLCAIYSAKGLSRIKHLLQTGELKKHSMKAMLEQLTIFTVPLEESQKPCFRNFNAHAELNGL